MYKKEVLKLSKIIAKKEGNFTTKDVEECGLSFEIFLSLSKLSKEKVLQNAKKIISLNT